MAKNLNVNLTFNAQTGQAKAQIQELQIALNKVALSSAKLMPGVNEQQLQKAASAAKQLALHLNNAYNVNTGKLDLSLLNKSLASAKTNISSLSANLLQAGSTGQAAFSQVASAIAQADRPILRLNSGLSQMWTVLKNTARWQISSSAIHGFITGVSSAYRYAQDLNESLNNIRIVTGQNIDQMAKFAVEANKAAKALSTTTTEYTNASLIYYQQGLNKQQVQERTDATIKMANVSRQSAEVVSDQMTAIWNNFAKAGDNLEYYGDVITALGAKTASSSDEIAQGLEKFAAVADTVGLSYEYATAALATVTAETRQSADVVGTAFKTLFARIEGLSLGETLDDGTNLNKYSAALEAVGVNIKDQYGQMKQMDTILDELGTKWGTLAQDQQIALAQTVAGVRQYTQMIALMDNWDKFKDNLSTAYQAEGTLTSQAEIYEESWEAASKRVKASMQSIYSDLFNDEFFIDLYDGFAKILDGVHSFIESIGGIKSALISIGAVFLSSVSGKIGPALENLKHNFTVVFQTAQQQANAVAGDLNKVIRQTLVDNASLPKDQQMSTTTRVSLENTLALNSARSQLAVVTKDLTATEMAQAEQQIAIINTYAAEANAIAEKIAILEQEKNALIDNAQIAGGQRIDKVDYAAGGYLNVGTSKSALTTASNELSTFIEQLTSADAAGINFGKTFSGTIGVIKNIGTSLNTTGADITFVKNLITAMFGESHPIVKKFSNELTQSTDNIEDQKRAVKHLGETLENTNVQQKDYNEYLRSQGKDGKAIVSNNVVLQKSYEQLAAAQERVSKAAANFNVSHTVTGLERLAQAGAAAGKIASISFGIQSISRAISDTDASPLQRLTSGLMGLSMVIPGVLGAFKSLDIAMGKNITLGISAVSATSLLTAAENMLQASTIKGITVDNIANALTEKNISLLDREAIATYISRDATLSQLSANEQNVLILGLQAMGLKRKAAGEITASANTLKHAIAQALLNAKMSEGAALALASAAQFLIIAAAIAAVVGVVYALYQSYNKANIEAKKAEAAATSLAEKYENVKSEVEGIKSAFEEYDSVVEKLNECTVGTEEWKAALEEVNNIIKGIIVDYPDLAKDIEFGYREDGSRYISNADEIIASADERLNTAEMQTISANLIAQQKRYESNVTDWKRSSSNFGVMVDAEMESDDVVPEKIQTSSLDIAKILLNNKEEIEEGLKNALTLEDKKELYNNIALEVLKNQGLSQSDIEYNLGSLTEALLNASDSFAETVINAGNEVSAAFENSMDIIADSNLDNEKYTAAEREVGSQYLETYIKDQTDKKLDEIDTKTRAWNGRNNEKTTDVWEQYLGAIGKDYTLANNAIKGHGLNASYQYLDNGEKKEVSIQEMAAAIAAAEAIKGLGDAANLAKESLNNIGERFKIGEDGISEGFFEKSDIENYIASGNLESLTQAEVEALRNGQFSYESWIGEENLENLARAELGFTEGQVLSEEEQTLLENKILELENNFIEAVNAIDYNSIGQNFSKGLSEIFSEFSSNDFLKQFNVPEQKTIEDAFSQVYNSLGSEGAGSLSEILLNAGENANELAEIITTIDWDNATPEDISSALEEAGISVSDLGEGWDSFVASMIASSKTIYTLVDALSALRDQIASIKKIAGEIEFGDVISDEDYDILLGYSKEIAALFTQTYDGWKFVGDAEKLNSILEGTTKSIEEVKKEYEAANTSAIGFFKAHEDEWTNEEGKFYVGGENADIQGKVTALGAVLSEFAGSDSPILDILPNEEVLREAMRVVSEGIDETSTEADKIAYDNAVAMVENAQGSLQQFMDDWAAGKFESQVAEELWVNSYIDSLNELEIAFNEGKISAETYAKTFDSIFQKEALAEGFDYEEVLAYANALKEANGAAIETEQEAKRLALAHQKMNRGIKNLADNWDDWSKALKSDDLSKKSKAIAGLRDVMSDLTGTDMSKLPTTFFESTKNAELLEKALQGDVEAINELSAEATKSLIVEMNLDASTTSNLQSLVDQTLNAIEVKDLEVGASLNDTGMYEAFQSLLDSGAVTVEQMNAILSGIGFEPEIQMQRIPIDNAVASSDGNYYTVEYVDTEGNTQTKRISSQQYNDASSVGYIEVPVINSKTTSYTGGGGSISKQNKSGGGGSGGGSKPRELTKKPKENRYHDLNNTLDDISESLKDINRELDAAYGISRTKAIEKMIELLKEEKEVLEDKLKANVEYLEDDQALLNARLDEGSRKFGITNTVEIDENNNLDNWESYMNSVYDQLNAYEKQYNELPESEKEKFMTEILEPFEKWLEELEEAGETFEETAEEQEDIIQELKDIQIEIMEANYDMWENELDKFEEITDDHVHQLERVLEHFSDSFFARAEKMAKMSEITDIYNTGHASTLSSAYNDLNTQYQNGDITIADFIDGMKRIQEMAEASIDELYDYMDQMTTYYADTVDMSLDIINGVIDQFDHFQNVLDHYANIYEIIQGTVDFDTQLDILNARKDMLMQEGESVRAAYDMYKSEREREEEEFLAAQEAFNAVSDLDPESDEYKAKYYAFMEAKNSYEAALAAEQEMREQLLANAEEYAQTIREIFTTEIEMFGEQMEKESLKLLDNVHSFDQLNEQIEYAKSLTEDWLTETNKVYETSKLINTAQGALEKTENSLAKNKLSAFIKETEQLQNQSKLSNFELEVQQKKYDLLLAEIALEEARNAKSTVRMRRDSEGNIGYVYTADADAINNAEQDLADAENDLYNLRLEGANEFAEKRLQAEQDYQDKLKELWTLCYVDHEISEEEYQARFEALSSSHYELMEGYAHIYNEAIRYDTRVTADAWSTEYKAMVLDTESWQEYTSKYLENVSKSYGEYQSNVEWLNNQINTSNDGVARNIRENLNAAIDETTAASEKLGKYTKDELIPALEKELIAVDNVADKFRDELIPQILETIRQYEALAAAALAAKQAAMNDKQDIEVDVPKADGGVTVDTGDVTGDPPTGGGGTPTGPTGSSTQEKVWVATGVGTRYVAAGKNPQGGIKAHKGSKTGESIYYVKMPDGLYYENWLFDYDPYTGVTLKGVTATGHNITQMKTGGYTGSWGPEGRLAMLHQKELVLNAEDTDNMLRTVSLVRDIIQRIDIGASTLPMRPGFAINSLGDTGSTLEQRVSIEANFPNVQDRYEIEEAFNNLINTASQFANRKKL